MIINGKLTRIDPIASVSVSGDVVYSTGDTIDVDVAIDEPTGQQRFVLGAAISDVSAVIYVLLDDLPAGTVLEEQFRVTANQEDQASITYTVERRRLRVHGGQSHYELFCKVVA